jgi:hypothetical protein
MTKTRYTCLAYKRLDTAFEQKLFPELQVDRPKKWFSTVAVSALKEFPARTRSQSRRSLDLIKNELRRKKLIGLTDD